MTGHSPPASASIKGSVLVDLVEDARKLLDPAAPEREAVEAALSPADRDQIAEGVFSARWYDVAFYARVMELVRDVLGQGRDEYVIERGRARGHKLVEAGIYQQMEYLGRLQVSKVQDPEERISAYGRDLRLLCTLSRSILDFTTWHVVIDPDHADRYRIEVTEAAAFPDILGLSTQGFMDAMSGTHREKRTWRYERASRDVVHFRMTRAL